MPKDLAITVAILDLPEILDILQEAITALPVWKQPDLRVRVEQLLENARTWRVESMLSPRTSELGQEGSSASTDAKPGNPTSTSAAVVLVGHACISGPQCPICGDFSGLRPA